MVPPLAAREWERSLRIERRVLVCRIAAGEGQSALRGSLGVLHLLASRNRSCVICRA